jgi:hypothetical protein
MNVILLDVAPGTFSFAPLLLILLLAFVAIAAVIFLARYLRRGKD